MKTTEIYTGSSSPTSYRIRIRGEHKDQWLVHAESPEKAVALVSKECGGLPVESFFVAGVNIETKRLHGNPPVAVIVNWPPEDWRGISRVDTDRAHAWFLRGYKNGTIHRASFPDRRYGSPEASLDAARKYRERLYSRLDKIPTSREARLRKHI